MKNIKIGTILYITFGILSLLIMYLGIIAYQQSDEIADQTDILYNHPLQVRRAIGEFKYDVTGMYRNFLIFSYTNNDSIRKINLTKIEIKKDSALKQIETLYT
jgi:hypothetical protein